MQELINDMAKYYNLPTKIVAEIFKAWLTTKQTQENIDMIDNIIYKK